MGGAQGTKEPGDKRMIEATALRRFRSQPVRLSRLMIRSEGKSSLRYYPILDSITSNNPNQRVDIELCTKSTDSSVEKCGTVPSS